jgi:integrase
MRHPEMPLASFIEPFLTSLNSPKSREDYARYLRQFDVFTGATTLRTALTLQNGTLFRDRVKERGLPAARNATMYLKSFATWLADNGTLLSADGGSVLARLKAPRVPKSSRAPLTEEDLEAIWAALRDRQKSERYRAIAYARLVLATGLGISVVWKARHDDVTFDASGGAWLTVRSGRWAKGPPLRLDTDSAAAVLQYMEEERPQYVGSPPQALFLREDGRAFRENGFAQWVKRIAEEIERATGIKWNTRLMQRTATAEAAAPFRDPDLRNRCMHILSGTANYEQAVTVGCQVFEERVRDAANPPTSHRSGVALMKFAFGVPVQLRLSHDPMSNEGRSKCLRAS